MAKAKVKKVKGHWPKGKRRNPDGGTWSRTRLGLQHLLDEHPQQGVVSARALAEQVGVSDRQVRRWISGQHRPSEECQALVAQWLADRRAALKSRTFRAK